ncbi:MAG: replicative helicase [Betaproteobacteria bacterium]|nr:replicative helicase [Betaproteobacteria bacterium]
MSHDQALPESFESEQACLSALLNGASLESIRPLKAGDFRSPLHGDIFGSIEALVTKGRPVDLITVLEHLKDRFPDEVVDVEYLQQLVAMSAPRRHAPAYAQRVREMAQRRALIETAAQAVEIAHTAAGDVAVKLDQIASLFVNLQRDQIARTPRSLSDAVLVRTEHYEAVERGEVEPGWRTGLPELDHVLRGGLRPGNLYILAARPSVGKSSLAQWIGMKQARYGRPCLFLSQEMTEAELADRGTSIAGAIAADAMQSGKMTREDWARITEVRDQPDMRNFYLEDQPALTLLDVRAKAKQVRGLKVLVLDYLQLCAGGTGREANRNSEIEQISRGLKQLAKEMGIAVIALSQLNREVEKRTNKRPNPSDLRDSGAIEQDADVILMLWRARELGNGSWLIGLDLPKNRQGRSGVEVALNFDGVHQAWSTSSEPLLQADTGASQRRRAFQEGD